MNKKFVRVIGALAVTFLTAQTWFGEPFLGKWQDYEGDTYEYERNGNLVYFSKAEGVYYQMQWEKVGSNEIKLSVPGQPAYELCSFVGSGQTLTVSGCPFVSVRKGVTNTWSGIRTN